MNKEEEEEVYERGAEDCGMLILSEFEESGSEAAINTLHLLLGYIRATKIERARKHFDVNIH